MRDHEEGAGGRDPSHGGARGGRDPAAFVEANIAGRKRICHVVGVSRDSLPRGEGMLLTEPYQIASVESNDDVKCEMASGAGIDGVTCGMGRECDSR